MSRSRAVVIGQKVSGKLDVDRSRIAAAVSRLDDGPIRITFERVRPKQSDAARGYYHGCVVEAAMTFTGNDHDREHDLLKAFCLDKADAREGRNGVLMQLSDGRYVVIGGSTADLDRIAYAEYVDRCREQIFEWHGYMVPDPDPEWREKDEEVA